MIQTLKILEVNINNENDNEPNTLKPAIHWSDQLKQKETMQVEYNSLIENKTWELTPIPKY